MKKIITSEITDSAQLPVMARTLSHLQEAYIELYDVAIKIVSRRVFNNTEFCILTGIENLGNLLNVTYTAGAIYHNGEVYLVDAAPLGFLGALVVVGTIVETYQAGEPTAFTDGVSRNTNAIRKIVLSKAVSGSGDFDLIGGTTAVEDEWHYVGAPGEPPYNTGHGFGPSFIGTPLRFKKDRSGFVHIEGRVTTTSLGNIVFTLPTGYQSQKQIDIPMYSNATDHSGYLNIQDSGAVSFEAYSGTTEISIYAIFFADQ